MLDNYSKEISSILKENDVADHQLEVFNFLDSISNKWEEILEKIPDSTLDICGYNEFPRNKEEEKMLLLAIERIKIKLSH